MPDAIVGVASNIQPEQNIPAALQLLDEAVGIRRRAPIYRTQPIERPEQETYWNTAVLVAAASMADLKHALQAIERRLGRVRTHDAYAARTIDLDVLVWDGAVVDADVPQRWFLQRLIEDLARDPSSAG